MLHPRFASCLKSFFGQVVLYGMLSANTYAQVTFTADTTGGCAPLSVNFTNTSSPPANYFRWDFGDGDTLWVLNALHTYDSSGTFQAVLQGWDTTGGGNVYIGSDTLLLTVNTSPSTPGSVSGLSSICAGQLASYSISSVSGATSYTWTFPAGWVIDNGQGTISITAIAGSSGNVCVIASNSCGNSALSCLFVTVSTNSSAPASAIATPNVICPGNSSTLSLSGGALGSGANWQWYSGACGGTYVGSGVSVVVSPVATTTYYVRGEGTCNTTACVTVTLSVGLPVSVTKTNVSCNGYCDGMATANVSGGSPPYTYQWGAPFFQTTSSATGLCAGTYSITVTDISGCSMISNVTINQPTQLILNKTVFNVTCNGACDAVVQFSSSGGVAPYTYTGSLFPMCPGPPECQEICPGTYSLIVTDANSCTQSTSITITQPNTLTVSISKTDDICGGGCNGTASASPTGGTLPYTYAWSNATTASANTGLCAGTYTVTITDNKGCTATASATIATSSMTVSITGTNATCASNCDGSASTTVAGGVSPYTYMWNDGSTNSTAIGLCPGNYYVTVTDINGCSAVSSANINVPPAISAAITVSPSNCGACDGSATVTPSNGYPPYSYLWNDSASQTNATATGLCNLPVTVTITDSSGCSNDTIFSVGNIGGFTISMSSTGLLCNGDSNGTATVTPSGGTAPFTYSWNNGQIDSTATGLLAGTYSVTVTDNIGCNSMGNISVTQPATIAISFTKTNASCNGLCDGLVTANVSGGSPPFTYLWSDAQVAPTATALCPGTYFVTVTDFNACTKTSSVTITEPALLSSTFTSGSTCNSACNGNLAATTTGGTTPYTYCWDATPVPPCAGVCLMNTCNNLCAGTYYVIITDANGCTLTGSTIVNTTTLAVTASKTDASCPGVCNGTTTANASGGTLPYSYQWSSGTGFQTSSNATGLCSGTYSVTVRDNKGCSVTSSVSVANAGSAISLSMSSVTNATCWGVCTGSATVNVSGGTAPFTYLWSPSGGNSQTGTGLCPDTYTVLVTDSAGCSKSQNTTIGSAVNLSIASTSTPPTCTASNGSATVFLSGGTSPYTYSWNNGNTTSAITNVPAGFYYVEIYDANGCYDTATFSFGTGVITFYINATYNICNNINTGSATVVTTGGTPPFSYLWNTTQTTQIISNLSNGTYTVTVTDGLGCTKSKNVYIGTTYNNTCKNTINGKVWADTNGNCIKDMNEWGLTSWLVTATKGNTSYNGWSYYNGYYSIMVDTGTYTVSEAVKPFWQQDCPASPGTYTVNFATVGNTISNIDFGNKITTWCSQLNLQIGSTNLRPCFNGYYVIYYWNSGTVPVNNVSIEVTFDNDIIPSSSYPAWTSFNGNTYTFNVGTVNPDQSWSGIVVYVDVSCSAILGSTKCVTAHIYPDSLCTPPNPVWDKSSIKVTGECVNGQVCFTIKNKGSQNMAGPSQYRIYSNNVKVFTGYFQLNSGDSLVVCWNSNGNTIRLEADQRPGHPGNSHPQASVELCGNPPYTDPPYAFSQITQVYGNNSDPFEKTYCRILTSSVDPNDKSVNPEGIPPGNFIDTAANLTYHINFQNTGTDTAFNIVIYDTLSPFLDVSTVEDGASSHPHAFQVLGEGVLEWTFSDILLPDSNIDEPGSHGFVEYSVKQLPGTPYGVSVDNRAGIIFDFNNPVLTNTVTNTVINLDSITNAAPVNFTADVPTGCAPLNVNFTNTGIASANYFRWSFGDGDTSWAANASHLYDSAGYYEVFLEGWDTTGGGMAFIGICGMTVSVYPAPSVNVSGIANVSCYGGYDGTATATASGGTGNYSYQWNTIPSQYTPSATGLYAGIYNILVTDEVGCYASQNVTVTEPAAIAIIASVNDANSPGNDDGVIDITVSGGTGAYTYEWSNSAITEDIDSLPSGAYTVTVTDANNCEGVYTDTVKLIVGSEYRIPDTEYRILIYPNPNNGDFRLRIMDLGFLNAELKIYDIFSREIFKSLILNPKSLIHLDLPEGVYVLKVEDDGVMIGLQKIVVNK